MRGKGDEEISAPTRRGITGGQHIEKLFAGEQLSSKIVR